MVGRAKTELFLRARYPKWQEPRVLIRLAYTYEAYICIERTNRTGFVARWKPRGKGFDVSPVRCYITDKQTALLGGLTEQSNAKKSRSGNGKLPPILFRNSYAIGSGLPWLPSLIDTRARSKIVCGAFYFWIVCCVDELCACAASSRASCI